MKRTVANTPPAPADRNPLFFIDGTLDDLTGFAEDKRMQQHTVSCILGDIHKDVEELTKKLIGQLARYPENVIMRETVCANYVTDLVYMLTRAQIALEMFRLKGIEVDPKNVYVQTLGSYARMLKEHKGKKYLTFVGLMVDRLKEPEPLTEEEQARANKVAVDIIKRLRG